MYRFFPTVFWNKGYPKRDEILEQVENVWKQYGLEDKTKFNYRVKSVREDSKNRWIINDGSNGKFDGVIAAVGSCGDAKMPHVPGQDKFKGQIFHSSQLDGKDVKDKNVIIIGGGASAVEAMEFVAKSKARKTKILARVSHISPRPTTTKKKSHHPATHTSHQFKPISYRECINAFC